MHGLLQRVMQTLTSTQASVNQRTDISSHFAGYLNAIMDQEIPTWYLQHKRHVDQGLEPTTDKHCRLSHASVEDVIHVIHGCPHISERYYLPMRHDALAKYVLRAVIIKNHPEHQYHHSREPEYIKKIDHNEYWWNLPIKHIQRFLLIILS